jgi:uncharacterized membrane protein YccF (DUF307 family)
MLKVLLNILWLLLAGLWLALAYCLAGVLACLLIVTLPFGLQAFKIASFAFWPFGRTLVKKDSAGAGSALGNILWLILFGWWLALAHIVTAFVQAITIIGLPLAAANVKLVPAALWPFGREVVPTRDVEDAMAHYREALSVEVADR